MIVNNVHEEFPGTRQGVDDLRKTFDKIGFEVTVKTDLTYQVCYNKC